MAEVLLKLAKLNEESKPLNSLYHFTGAPYSTWYDFAKCIFEESFNEGLIKKRPILNKLTTSEYPLPAPRPADSRLDCSRIINKFPDLKNNWQEEVKRVVKVLKEEGF